MVLASTIDLSTKVGKMKLVAGTDSFSDDECENMLMEYEIENEADIDDVFQILNVVAIYRPELYKKLEDTISELKAQKGK
jgi:hypothetical protein